MSAVTAGARPGTCQQLFSGGGALDIHLPEGGRRFRRRVQGSPVRGRSDEGEIPGTRRKAPPQADELRRGSARLPRAILDLRVVNRLEIKDLEEGLLDDP